jgi:NADH-quinone oxidoreductase subunit G
MPKLVIDDLEIEVAPGTKVIEAAEQLGIMIPRFCYHKALGSVGACRMCAVRFLQGPFKGVQMSCLIDAQDGMVVSTTDDEAVAFRRYIIELLMMNHPHDCPVCDEGGQCLLQDMTVSGGHGMRRYLGKKRTYRDQNLGMFIAHEMNRCIHCYRCSRFYQEFTGYRDLGPMQVANRVYFGRFQDGQLESPFSGNLVDLCPTGVYTDKPARFKGRRWDFERLPSLCIHCSLGCSTIANARYRTIVRVEARFNDAVNGFFICDRGRFGFPYANHPNRPREARIDGYEGSLEDAVQAAAKKLVDIEHRVGPHAIACLGSLRSSLETQGILKHLCQLKQWPGPDYFLDYLIKRKVMSAISQLDNQVAVSLRQIEAADFILVVGVDPLGEAPMLALAMRQANRREATIAVIDPRPVSLPFPFAHLAVPTWDLNQCLELIIREMADKENENSTIKDPMAAEDGSQSSIPLTAEIQEHITALAAALRTSRNPVLICGTDIVPETTPSLVGACARSVLKEKGNCGLFYVLPGANAFGAGLLSTASDLAFMETVGAIERGEVKALIVVESDPFWQFPDRARLEQALGKLEFLLVLDYVPSPITQQAHIFLPTSTLFESVSSFINQEGRIQMAHPVYHGGTPLSQVSGGTHPPRDYTGDLPGGGPKPAWQILTDLADALSLEGEPGAAEYPLSLVANMHPLLAGLKNGSVPVGGLHCLPDAADAEPFSAKVGPTVQPEREDELQLLFVDSIFGAEELSRYSDVIHQVEGEPCLSMHTETAGRLGLAEGDRVLLTLDGGTIETGVSLSHGMDRRTLVLPRHRKLAWQKVKGFSTMVTTDRIAKLP